MKLSKALFLTVGLSISAFAAKGAQDVPVDLKGGSLNPQYGGIATCRVTSSTGTVALLCDTGSGIILDVVASSVAVTDSIVFRDSATANTSSTVLYSIDKGGLLEKPNVFPRYKNGLSVNALVAPTGAGPTSAPSWTITYIPLD